MAKAQTGTELYRILTESLLEHWELQKYKNIIPGGNPLTTKLRRMEHLAEHMMTLSPEYERYEWVILIPEREIKRIFKQTILEKHNRHNFYIEYSISFGFISLYQILKNS